MSRKKRRNQNPKQNKSTTPLTPDTAPVPKAKAEPPAPDKAEGNAAAQTEAHNPPRGIEEQLHKSTEEFTYGEELIGAPLSDVSDVSDVADEAGGEDEDLLLAAQTLPPPDPAAKPASRVLKREKRGRREKLRMAAIWVCALVACASLIYIGTYVAGALSHRWAEDEWNDIYNKLPSRSAAPLPTENPNPSATPSSVEPGGDLPHSPAPPTEMDLLIAAEAEGRIYFKDFLDINAEYWGHIKIEGLKITQPYVWTNDNETYLKKDFNGKNSKYGTIFMDCRNHPYLTNYNNVFYGHNMNDGSMFSSLLKYKNISTYAKAPVIEIDSLTGVTTWLVFAAYTCEKDYGYINTWVSGDEYAWLLEEIHNRSLFHTDIDVNEDDRIITLSTCNTLEYRDTRFVLHARRLRPGEALPTEFNAVKNENQKLLDVPDQLSLSELSANEATALRHPRTNKMYYYHRSGNGLTWYIGNTDMIQGPYSAYSGKITNNFTSLSAVHAADNKMYYLAGTGFGTKPGVYILNGSSAGGSFKLLQKDPVTPAGVDARWPVLSVDPYGALWVTYVVEEEGRESIYRMRTAGGEPELVATTEGRPAMRPAALVWIGDTPMCIWRETASGNYQAARVRPESGTFARVDRETLALPTDCDRLVMYGKYDEGVMKVMTETGGVFCPASDYNLNALFDVPLVPSATAVPPLTETPTPTQPPDAAEPPAAETPLTAETENPDSGTENPAPPG